MPAPPPDDSPTLAALRAACAAFFTRFDPDLRAAAETLAAAGAYRLAPAGTCLLARGDVAGHFYYLHRGAVRNYLPGGRHGVTTWLSLDGTLVTAMASLSSGEPSQETVETLEDCELLAFAATDLQRAYRDVPGTERLGRLVVEHYFRVMTRRLYDNAIMTARDRYAQLLDTHPEIIARVPLGIIAGYLQMTPESLSRIRAQLARGDA